MGYHNTKKNWLHLIFCACVAGAFSLLIAFLLYFSLPIVMAAKCVVELEQPGRIQIFYSNGLQSPPFKETNSRKSPLINGGSKQFAQINLPAVSIHSLRVDLGESAGRIKLYGLEFYGPIVGEVKFDASTLAKTFTPVNNSVTMQLKEEYLLITAKNNDPYLVTTSPILPKPLFTIIFVPIIFGVVLFVLLLSTPLSYLRELFLPAAAVPSVGRHMAPLDGLRGLAVLLVVADHCHGRFTGLGSTGVWIFIALSGFLLAKPFAENPDSSLSIRRLSSFFIRRCTRIVPSYYFYVTIIFLVTTRFDLALRHYLFLEGAGHLWVITQIVIFYLLLPCFLVVNYLLFKQRKIFSFFFFLIVACLANRYLKLGLFSLYGLNNEEVQLYLGVFLSGVAAAYFCQSAIELLRDKHHLLKTVEQVSSGVGVIALLIILFGSTTNLYGGNTHYAQKLFPWFGGGAALLILAVSLSNNTILEKLLNWQPLCSLGVISFSFYLYHPLVIGVLQKGAIHFTGQKLSQTAMLLMAIIASYFLSCLTYRLLENRNLTATPTITGSHHEPFKN